MPQQAICKGAVTAAFKVGVALGAGEGITTHIPRYRAREIYDRALYHGFVPKLWCQISKYKKQSLKVGPKH